MLSDEELESAYLDGIRAVVETLPGDQWEDAGLRAVEAAVRADQIEKDAAICQRIQDAPEFQESGPGVVTAKIVIRAQLEGTTDE